jgi:hypothetical protein
MDGWDGGGERPVFRMVGSCCWSVVGVVVAYGICYFPLFLYFYCNPGVAYSRGRWVGFLYF